VIAYGSLMTGLGLANLGRLPVTDAARVRLRGCRRGFGKLSMYGDRFAMVLEPLAWSEPIVVETVAPTDLPAGVPEALALTLALPELAAIAVREGYKAEAFWALAQLARESGRPLASHLWSVFESVRFDYAAYRRALFAAVGYTSAHYIPHPVSMAGGAAALVFLPPGEEGSGSDGVVPIRVQSAMTRVLSVRQVWHLKPNTDQLDYFAMCLLAETHAISLADVCADLDETDPLIHVLRARLAADHPHEVQRFRAVLGLDAEAYAARFRSATRRSRLLPA
jgi:hypothetical protein